MTEREAFIEAIAAQPADATAPLAFADWLQEHGEERRADFIRLNYELFARQGELGWPSPPPAEIQALQARLQEWLELHGSAWFEPFCRALGVEPPPPTRRRWLASRLWRRLTGKQRPAGYWFGDRLCGYARLDGWGDGPIRALWVWLGFVRQLELALGYPVRDLPAALRLEPVDSLSISLGEGRSGWRALNSPCLARIRNLGVRVPSAVGWGTARAFESICQGENWTGVRDFDLCGDVLQPVPHDYFELLASSPLASGLESLSIWTDHPDLRPLTTSPRLVNLRKFGVWTRLPNDAADLITDAVFRPNLEELRLSLTHIGDDGVARLASVAWPKLHSLDLGELSDAGVRSLLSLVPQLSHLGLASGTITDAGARALADAINSEKLEFLSLSCNPLSPQTVAALRARFGERFHFRTQAEDGAGP